MHHQIHAQGATQPHPQEDIHRRRGRGSIETVHFVTVRVRVRDGKDDTKEKIAVGRSQCEKRAE